LASTTPLQDIVGAFKSVLDGAELGVVVYEESPYDGAEQRSVVLSPVAGYTNKPSLGLRIASSIRALEEHCRLQIDCFYDDQANCRRLVDKVSQTIFDHADELERVCDIHDLRRVMGPIPGPVDAGLRESHMILDFQFYTHRAVT
jgi:hypothetical protein